MKITIDNIVGNAGRIQTQRNNQEKTQKGSSRSDSAEIVSRLDSRVISLQSDLRETQTELSKNQIIKEGIAKAVDDLSKGKNPSTTVNAVTFNDKKVLLDYLGESEPSKDVLFEKDKEISEDIQNGVKNLTRLQVEAENIYASNLSEGKEMDKVLKNSIESSKLSTAYNSTLNADMVSRLIR
jgi:hypothetical protein